MNCPVSEPLPDLRLSLSSGNLPLPEFELEWEAPSLIAAAPASFIPESDPLPLRLNYTDAKLFFLREMCSAERDISTKRLKLIKTTAIVAALALGIFTCFFSLLGGIALGLIAYEILPSAALQQARKKYQPEKWDEIAIILKGTKFCNFLKEKMTERKSVSLDNIRDFSNEYQKTSHSSPLAESMEEHFRKV